VWYNELLFNLSNPSPVLTIESRFGILMPQLNRLFVLSRHRVRDCGHVQDHCGGAGFASIMLRSREREPSQPHSPTYDPLPVYAADERCSHLQSGGQPHLLLKHRLYPPCRARLPEQLQPKRFHTAVTRDDSPRRNLLVLLMARKG
jgi:hypothetical protein